MSEVKDHHYYHERNPMARRCSGTEDHPGHQYSVVGQPYFADPKTVRTWYACPGWTTTHVLEVREAGGRVVGEQKLDLRTALDYNGSTNDPVLTLLYEADEAGLPRPSDDELLTGAAAARVAPEVCPWDSDRCHEHLYDFAAKIEGAGE